MAMTVVIQCAARKDGAYLRAATGDKVKFVVQPRSAPSDPGWTFAHPDETSTLGGAWRAALSRYNERFVQTGDNPDGLKPAWRLYTNPAYRGLARRFGTANLYILSAGWGLVHADYLLPNYDITFSKQADSVSIRQSADWFDDARQMPDDVAGPVLLLGGLSYLPMFRKLTNSVRAERIVYFNSGKRPGAGGCRLIRYETSTRTNWHYGCASDLASGRIIVQ
jgi:hypothetical protein